MVIQAFYLLQTQSFSLLVSLFDGMQAKVLEVGMVDHRIHRRDKSLGSEALQGMERGKKRLKLRARVRNGIAGIACNLKLLQAIDVPGGRLEYTAVGLNSQRERF
jgi:hypothetical protein